MVFSKVFDHGVRVGREGQIHAICRGAFAPKNLNYVNDASKAVQENKSR